MTSAPEAVAGFQIQNCMPQLCPRSRCITVIALKFPKHVELPLGRRAKICLSIDRVKRASAEFTPMSFWN